MAGTSATVEAVIGRGGISRSRASKFAKAGMQAGFLPKSGKGGGEKNTAHWQADALAFYGISLAVAEVSTELDTVVPFFLNCNFWKRVREDATVQNGSTVRVEHPQTNHRGLNALMSGYTDADRAIEGAVNRNKVGEVVQEVLRAMVQGVLTRDMLDKANFRLSFTIADMLGPHMTIHYDYSSGDSVMDFYYPDEADTAKFGKQFQRSMISRGAVIGPDYLAVLADLLRDSMERAGNTLLPPDGGSPTPRGKKNGATPDGVTPLETSSADEPTACKRGHTTHESSAHSCDPMGSVRVRPGNVSGLATDPPPNPVPEDFTHERERIAA